MKSVFPGHYRPTKEESAKNFKDCIFCFDTNVLLNLYRYTPTSRDSLINTLKNQKIKNRIWLPHRVGLEYQRRRIEVFLEELNLVEKAENMINYTITSIKNLCRTEMWVRQIPLARLGKMGMMAGFSREV